MGGGSKGLAKLRRGCVGRTQAVGMVLLGASSLLECSGCVCGSKDGCCGAGPSLTAAREESKKKEKPKNYHWCVLYVPFPTSMVIFSRRDSISLHSPRRCRKCANSSIKIKNQMSLRAAVYHLKVNISSFKEKTKSSMIFLSPSLYLSSLCGFKY